MIISCLLRFPTFFTQFGYFLVGFFVCIHTSNSVCWLLDCSWCQIVSLNDYRCHTTFKKYTPYDRIARMMVRDANSTLPCSVSYAQTHTSGRPRARPKANHFPKRSRYSVLPCGFLLRIEYLLTRKKTVLHRLELDRPRLRSDHTMLISKYHFSVS